MQWFYRDFSNIFQKSIVILQIFTVMFCSLICDCYTVSLYIKLSYLPFGYNDFKDADVITSAVTIIKIDIEIAIFF